ncbi:hypothetical protein [Amycolatopsis thermophila]|uniref:Uncharacterized protein n=1 Tax=Amycolatopsis thermophila TaxID=206084 RepID=A0ABU0ES68_9PSEU|nr:hypothetical protein [Amycolatopsis thermophila]MDQ0377948.1 hypothetical protein [Amycolatopsis thermophila]
MARDGRAVPPSPEKRRRLNELADWHQEWARRNLDRAEFDRGRARAKSPSDYNLHYLDVNPSADAEDEFQARAREIMGLGPDGSRREA